VHDYHLLLLPAMLARARPDVAVGLSLHTPIDIEAVGDVPVVESLIRGLRAARVIGVQTARDASALHELIGAVRPDEANPPTVVVSPVSVDPAALESVRRQPVVAALADRERRRAGGRTLIVGVDRLDYTKGVLERLEAYRLAFDRGWMAADGVRIVQVAQPTRPGVAEYRSLRLEVERAVHQMKADFQRPDGTSAIEAQIESVGHREVVALLASADIAMVTPRRDGMNLVAKEFSVVNSRDGVLVLSRGAGAADELGPASVVVDGAEPASVAAGLRTALALPAARRREMAERRGSVVHGWTSEHWCRDFLSRLRSESDSSAPATR
jgi:trehalose-6-phosphate synthase